MDLLKAAHELRSIALSLHASLADDLEAELGIQLTISERPTDKVMVLNKIVVPKANRSSGVGSIAMTRICDYADQKGYVIALTPSSDFGGSKGRLEQFYSRFGFVPNKGKNKDFRFQETMLREPT